MGFDLTGLGQWSDDREFKVEAAQAVAYAAATNDTNPRHTSGELAPPVFAVVPVWEAMMAAAGRVTPPEVLIRVVHGSQDMRLHRAIVPGEVLRSRAAAVGVQVRGTGTTEVLKAETRDESGELVNEQYVTLFFRGVGEGDSGGEAAPEHKLSAEHKAAGPIAEITYLVDADQTYRYADASGDRMPIHIDDAIARSVGLPGIIVHGLCTMAFTGRAVIEAACAGDPARLRRLAVRFSRPVLPGHEITTRIFDAGPTEGGLSAYGFETVNPEGQAVVKDGLAEVAG
ncbi:MAG TPA: MaoC/PaaZ C-terminal domain-containing protein [Acidimicrobiia bacterium]|nr:MaoC/PaaZ C-terminal domain-containing protein [Acidimicrobiia bacterium]